MPTEQGLIAERMRKVQDLRAKEIDPYPYSYERTHTTQELQEQHKGLQPEERTLARVRASGRIISLRRMGKATFLHILDEGGKLQVYLKEDNIGVEKYSVLKLLDIGDWIGIAGMIFKTKTGEVTVEVKELKILCKSTRPLPEKWHGLQDTELRYRQRDVDLIVNPQVRITMAMRSRIIHELRSFLHSRRFMEVETPILQPIYGGANARPFTTTHHDLKMTMYLRISPELYLKRLLVGGFEKVFEIGHQFRNESIDRTHNPEFTSMECYQAYADYNTMMELTEDVYTEIAKKVLGTTTLTYQGTTIELKKPWRRLKMVDAIKEFAGIDVTKMSREELLAEVRSRKLVVADTVPRGILIAELFSAVEPFLIQPTFIINHPIETTPLCKPLRDGQQDFVERFEPFINGWEIGNAYSELNDPVLQRKLLEMQADQLRAGIAEANPMDEDFVRAIEQGMPPTGGLGLGIDRMIMLFTNQASIRDVLLFPTMKPRDADHNSMSEPVKNDSAQALKSKVLT